MRIGILALLQESNTFLPAPTELVHFQQDVLLVGDAMAERFGTGALHEISGFFAGLIGTEFEPVPIFAGRALPYGVITAETWAQLMAMMFAEVERAGHCDGYLVSAHGATVSASSPDADGYWLSELRSKVGATTPIIGTLDLHANLSPKMVDACDALVGYRTNPHIDQFQCGKQAAALMVRTLRGEIRPTQAASFPPMLINIEQQETAVPPCKELIETADLLLNSNRVLSNSVLLGFPYADVPELGSACLAVTDDNPALAQETANQLAQRMWCKREQFIPKLVSLEDAIQQAEKRIGPVCLLDMGDNVGGGSPGDSTWLAHALRKSSIPSALVCLCDARAVKDCEAVGPGQRLQLKMGGKSGDLHGTPLQAEVVVVSLHEGQFEETEPRHGGFTFFDQGRSAIVRCGENLTLLLTSRRMAPFSLVQLTSCGLDPNHFQVLVAKGVISPVAAYRSVANHFIRVNTPGVTTADLSLLPYKNRRRPCYPFEPNIEWEPTSFN